MLSNLTKIILLERIVDWVPPIMCVVRLKGWLGVSHADWSKQGARSIGLRGCWESKELSGNLLLSDTVAKERVQALVSNKSERCSLPAR